MSSIIVLKFLHVLIALSLMGITLYCFAAAGSKRFSVKPNKLLIYLGLIAVITGTFLVYPRHFNFHTPWIQAAYILALLFTVILLTMTKKNKLSVTWQRVMYLTLIIILLAIAHDAVTKTTFLF